MPFKLPYKYISVQEIHQLLKSDNEPHKDYIIVDVRGEDYTGGNIENWLNLPSEEFEKKVHELVEETKEVPIVIFHCALSQQRGPKVAQIYAETRDRLQKEGKDKAHEVFVFQGRFSEFQLKYKDDPLLVENWDKRTWNGWYY